MQQNVSNGKSPVFSYKPEVLFGEALVNEKASLATEGPGTYVAGCCPLLHQKLQILAFNFPKTVPGLEKGAHRVILISITLQMM